MTDFIVVREAHMNYPDVNLSATERLQQILGSVIMLVRGEIDNPMFEEECHQLVGAGGYVWIDMIMRLSEERVFLHITILINNLPSHIDQLYLQITETLNKPSILGIPEIVSNLYMQGISSH